MVTIIPVHIYQHNGNTKSSSATNIYQYNGNRIPNYIYHYNGNIIHRNPYIIYLYNGNSIVVIYQYNGKNYPQCKRIELYTNKTRPALDGIQLYSETTPIMFVVTAYYIRMQLIHIYDNSINIQ